MFKTISAALLAVSVLAAPAMAGTKTAQAPVIKTTQAPVIKPVQAKASVLNANAKMGGHHHKHHRHHRFPQADGRAQDAPFRESDG